VLAAEAIQIQRRVVQQNTPSLHAPTANKWAALPTLLFGAWEGLELESREKRGRGELGKPDPPKKNILRFVFLYLKRASAKHLGTSFTDQSVRFQGLFRQFSQCRECSRKINVNRIDGMDAARARGEVSSRAKQKLKTDSEGVKTNKRYTNVLRQSKVNLHRDAQSHGFFLSLMTNFFFAPPTVPEVAAPTPCLANALLPVPVELRLRGRCAVPFCLGGLESVCASQAGDAPVSERRRCLGKVQKHQQHLVRIFGATNS